MAKMQKMWVRINEVVFKSKKGICRFQQMPDRSNKLFHLSHIITLCIKDRSYVCSIFFFDMIVKIIDLNK